MLKVDRHDGWTRLTLDRPEARNALSTPLLAALADAVEAEVGAGARALLIAGEGGHFAAGADIGEIEAKTSAEAAHDPRMGHWARLRACPVPVVAAVDGYALGGGLELALMADLLVVGATAKLGLPETNLGLVPGAGGMGRLVALIGRARATRMVLAGEIIDAATAEAWGLAALRAEGSARPLAEEWAARLADRAPLALREAKAALVAAAEGAVDFAAERAGFVRLMDSADKAEGIAAFRAKRPPVWGGR